MVADDKCFEIFDQADDPHCCQCKGIVLNAYVNLLKAGLSENEALKIASRVLRHHYPSPTGDDRNVVECWVFQNSDHAPN